MHAVRHRVTAGAIDAPSWEPFGWLPVPDTDVADGAHRLAFEWGDPHVNVISHGPEEVTRSQGAFICSRLYRHDTHTQVLLVLDRPSVLAVAPAPADFSDVGDLGLVRAFVLGPLDAVVLHRGTWHWGPFPLGDEPVHLFNVQGFGYRDDNASVDLEGLGLEFEVRLPG
jgi:hypothetical protein